MAESSPQPGDDSKRRTYASPVLIDYGAVAKLTQGSTGTVGDAGNAMMSACL